MIEELIMHLESAIEPGILIRPNDGKLVLEENDKAASLRHVNLAVGAKTIALKFDMSNFPGTNTFTKAHPLMRHCDAIVFSAIEGKTYILFIELKSSRPERKDVSEQLLSARCFIDYLDSFLINYCKVASIRNLEMRFIVFHGEKIPLNKRWAKESYSGNTDPANPAFIPVHEDQTHYIRHLVGKPA
jgi:hypothetical protein